MGGKWNDDRRRQSLTRLYPNQKLNVEDILKIADSFYDNGGFKEAIDYYNQVLAEEPYNSSAYEGRGCCYYALLDIDQAIFDLTSAVKYDSQNHSAYYNRAMIWYHKKDLANVKNDFGQAYSIYGDSIEYTSNFALAHFELKNYTAALELLLPLLEEDKYNPWTLEVISACYFEAEQFESAIEFYQRLLKVNSNDVNAYNNIAFCLLEAGLYKEAIRHCNTALHINPGFAYAYNNRGFCRFKLGDPQGGLADVNESLDLDPSNSYAYRNRALIYESQKKIDLAVADLERALTLGFTNKFGLAVEKDLKRIKG